MEPGDIVQIIDESHQWYPCLLIVGEDKGWGVMAACLSPLSNTGNDVGEAWIRIKNEQFEKVGKAVIWKSESNLIGDEYE